MLESYDKQELHKIKEALHRKHGANHCATGHVEQVKRKVIFESRIMLVDDSAMVRKILKRSFVDFGFEAENIIEACDGEEAICLLMEYDDFSLIISDVNMPKIDGLGLLATVMKNAAYRDVNILLLTSENPERYREQTEKYGIEVFVKPFNKDAFFAYLIKMMVD